MSQIHLMSIRHSAFYAPYLMTMAGGYLRHEGLEYTYAVAASVPAMLDGMRDGGCHVSQSAVAANFAALERGEVAAVMHFAQINARDGFFIAGREPEPTFSWDRLRGKTVLVDHFFQPLAMFKYGLHRVGVDYADLRVIDAGDVAAMERAFRQGVGDYVHLQGPAPQQFEFEGIGHVVAAVGGAVGPVAFSSLCATPAWLEIDMARAFMRAYRRALACVIAAPADEIAARLFEAGFFPAIEPQVLIGTVRAYQRLGCWEADPRITRQAYEKLLDVFSYGGLISRRHAYELSVVPPPA